MQSVLRGSALGARSSAFVASTVAPVRRIAIAPVKVLTVDVEASSGGKLKTRKSAAKRFKVTGGGKVMARKAGKQHFNEKKSRNQVRELSKMYVIHSGDINNVIKCLPNSGIGK